MSILRRSKLWRALTGKSIRVAEAEAAVAKHQQDMAAPMRELKRNLNASNQMLARLQKDIAEWHS